MRAHQFELWVDRMRPHPSLVVENGGLVREFWFRWSVSWWTKYQNLCTIILNLSKDQFNTIKRKRIKNFENIPDPKRERRKEKEKKRKGRSRVRTSTATDVSRRCDGGGYGRIGLSAGGRRERRKRKEKRRRKEKGRDLGFKPEISDADASRWMRAVSNIRIFFF